MGLFFFAPSLFLLFFGKGKKKEPKGATAIDSSRGQVCSFPLLAPFITLLYLSFRCVMLGVAFGNLKL